jgi:DNA-binding NarL/FixJ family response regulator
VLDFAELPQPDVLLSQERQILSLTRKGCTDPEMADRLGISLKSLRERRRDALARLGLNDPLELVFYAAHHQI